MSRPNSVTLPLEAVQRAGQNVEQRCLAGAIRADDQPALARLDCKRNVGQRPQTAEVPGECLDDKCAQGPPLRLRKLAISPAMTVREQKAQPARR